MSWLRRFLFGLVAIGVLTFVGLTFFKTQIASFVFSRGIDQRVGSDHSASLPDGLHVYMCGSGSPMPDATRAGPCLGVLAGNRAYIFDVGSGGVRNLGSMGFPFEKLQTVYLTHLHSDHIDGLGELLMMSWIAGGRSSPTPVIGPQGTPIVVEGFNAAYRIDSGYRIAHHGTGVANPDGYGGLPIELNLPAGPAGSQTVFKDDDLTITAIRVDHAPVDPAFGYRIDYKDRSVAISGDTVFHPGFVASSSDVDLMIHEALNPKMVSAIGTKLAERGQTNNAKIFADILDYHASPLDAARAADEAGAEQLLLTHIVPPLPSRILHTLFLGDAKKAFDGPITIGQDGLLLMLPAGSQEISKRNLL